MKEETKPLCPQCGVPASKGRGGWFCETHGFDPNMNLPAEPVSGSGGVQVKNYSQSLTTRYQDAYNVARATNGVGGVVKILGAAAAMILCGGGLLMASSSGPREVTGIAGIVGICLGIGYGILFYVIGILISAQGQILKATLDSAVNSSPLITDDQRVQIMSL